MAPSGERGRGGCRDEQRRGGGRGGSGRVDNERALGEAAPDLLQPVQLLLEECVQVAEGDVVAAAMVQHTRVQ